MAKVDRPLITSTPFRDISLSFSRHPVTNDIGVFTNEDAIKRSVTMICHDNSSCHDTCHDTMS